MQFSVLALAAFAASAVAQYNGTAPVVYTTEVVTAYVTFCPAATQITHGGVTYTATASETLTITNCPCTIVKPVITSSVVICKTCAPTVAPVYTNATSAAPTTIPQGIVTGTINVTPISQPTTAPILEANSGSKAIAFSGASLVGLLGFAAYFL